MALIRLGGRHSCGLTQGGEAYCWGYNGMGQLGVGDTVERSTPTRVMAPEAFRDLAAGGEHTCGLGMSGTVWCWGARTSSQFEPLPGSPCYDKNYCAVPTITDSVPPSIAIDAKWLNTCGLDTARHLWCWGNNWRGSVDSVTQYSSVSVGGTQVCGLATTGAAYCYPDLGLPVEGGHTFQPVVATAAASACGLENHRVWCWGFNTIAQLANYEPRYSLTPLLIIGHPH